MPSPALEGLRSRLMSVRTRLTLWNVLVLALVLVVTGALLRQSVQASLRNTIDADLLSKATHFHQGGPPGGRPGRQGRGDLGPDNRDSDSGPGIGGPFDDPDSDEGGPFANVGNAGTQRQRPPRRQPIADASREDLGRPIIVDLGPRGSLSALRGSNPFDRSAFQEAVIDSGPVYSTVWWGTPTQPLRVVTLRRSDGPEGGSYVVQTAASLTNSIQEVDLLTRGLFAVIPLALIAAGVGAAFLTGRALQPVRAVTRAASGIGAAHDLSARLDVPGNDEFAELASTFNGMMTRLEGAFHNLEQAYEQQRRFVADASHELRTPLTIIKANTSLALTDEALEPDVRDMFTEIDRGVDRTNRIVQDLFLLARSDSGQLPVKPRPLDVGSLVGDLVEHIRLSRRAETGRTTAAIEYLVARHSGPLLVNADDHYLERLFRNLIENAFRHTPPDGRVTVSVAQEGDTVIIDVSDTGEGIAPEHLARVTERFYRVDSARARTDGGTGLGLAISESIAAVHGGSLRVQSKLGLGTTVSVTLPLVSPVPVSLAR